MNISEVFGSKVFGDEVMRARLPARVYKSLKAQRILRTGSNR